MIINVSGRTDIAAFYSEWFINRIRDGYADVRNPFYPRQVSRIPLDSNHVDLIVFCTKNPIPLFPYLEELKDYSLLFQITLTPYTKETEPRVIGKGNMIKAFHFLASKYGKDRVMLRYDPIFINAKYTISYHEAMFRRLLEEIKDDISRVIISFIDFKKNTRKHEQELGVKPLSQKEIETLAEVFSRVASSFAIPIQTCAEPYDLTQYGFRKGGCIDLETVYHLTGKTKGFRKNHNRSNCGCVQTVDLGVYNTCPHFCRYCYANYDEEQVISNYYEHDPESSLLIGHLEEDDKVTVRES